MATKNKLAKLISSRAVDYPVNPRPTAEQQAERRRYEAQDALRTLTRAEEIKRDRALMKDVKCCAREEAKRLSSVLGKK